MKKFLYITGSIFTLLFLILFSVFTVVNTQSFYTDQYSENNTETATGMSAWDLERATVMLLDYLNDERDDLDMQANEFGIMSETFDEREKTHMVDVKALYMNFEKIMYALAALSVGIFIYLFVTDRQNFINGMSTGCTAAMVVTVVLCAVFGLVFTVGFNSFWTMFHHVFFTNDLWLLDPRISTMINMFPLNFWLAMCSKILIRFGVLFAAFFAGIKIVRSLRNRKAQVTVNE